MLWVKKFVQYNDQSLKKKKKDTQGTWTNCECVWLWTCIYACACLLYNDRRMSWSVRRTRRGQPVKRDYILVGGFFFSLSLPCLLIESSSAGERGRCRGWAEPLPLSRLPRRSPRWASWVTWRRRDSPRSRCRLRRLRAVCLWSAPQLRWRLRGTGNMAWKHILKQLEHW